MELKLLAPILLALVFCAYNFFISWECQDVSWDGFGYLLQAREKADTPFPSTIRSPLLAYIVPPSLYEARVAMVLFFLASIFLTYKVCLQLTRNDSLAAMAATLLGSNWWLAQHTVYIFPELIFMPLLLLSTYFALRGAYGLAGVFAALAFLIRADSVFVLIPLGFLALREKKLGRFVLSFLAIGVGFELLLNLWFWGELNHSVAQFINWNFIASRPVQHDLPPHHYLLRLFEASPLLLPLLSLGVARNFREKGCLLPFAQFACNLLVFSLFPPKAFRWVVAGLPFASIAAAYGLKQLGRFWPLAVMAILLHSSYSLLNIKYPELDYGRVDWSLLEGKSCCSNYWILITYHTSTLCREIFWEFNGIARPSITEETALKSILKHGCEWVVLLKFKGTDKGRPLECPLPGPGGSNEYELLSRLEQNLTKLGYGKSHSVDVGAADVVFLRKL